MNFYFAYGSNMDETQMRTRCPDYRLLGAARLRGYRFAITIFSDKRQSGCADIIPESTQSVYGALYELTDADLAALDRAEAMHLGKYRRIPVVVEHDGRVVDAYAYEVVTKEAGLFPSAEYMAQIIGPAERFGFPESYIAQLRSFLPR